MPLEQALNGVEGLDVMRSKSVPQLSSIVLIFKPGTDEIHARQLVSERMALATTTLPTWAAPPFMMPPLSSTSRVMKIGISSKDKSVMDLSMIAYWTIRARLLGVPGVANVAIWGERLKMLQVQVDPKRMAADGRHARPGHGGQLGRPRRRAAAVLRRRASSAPAASSTRRTSAFSIRHVLPDRRRRRPGAGADRPSRTASALLLSDVADWSMATSGR